MKMKIVAQAFVVVLLAQVQTGGRELIRYKDSVFSPFKRDRNGNYTATYSVARSDTVGWSIAFNCPSMMVNMSIPDLEKTPPRELPGGPGMPMKWEGWKTVKGTYYEGLFRQICAKQLPKQKLAR